MPARISGNEKTVLSSTSSINACCNVCQWYLFHLRGGAACNGVVERGLAIGASNVAGIGAVTAIAAAAIAAATSNNGTSTTVTATAG